jgi:hypothetical protein
MKIRVTAFGQIKRYIENYCGEINLPDDASLADMLHYIDYHWSKEFPEYIWNKNKKQFRGPVVIMVGNQAVTDHDTVLCDGQEVKLYKVLVGG